MDELQNIRKQKLKELEERAARPTSGAQGMPFKLHDATFDEEVAKHDLVLVDFWAPWCGPCRMVAPVIEQLARDYRGRVSFGKLNTDNNQMTAMRFRVMSIPTLILFRDGKPVDQVIGAVPRQQLEKMLDRHLT
ncbi:MAG: thioredoxin [Candidatus Thermoplasmatota archaeon]|nr:thioredoxin [Candidatus Thermoplasmatota archaeon]